MALGGPSSVSGPLPSLVFSMSDCTPVVSFLSGAGRDPNLGFGAKDCWPLGVLLGVAVVLLPAVGPPARDCLRTAGADGGPIEVLVGPVLGRAGFPFVIDGALVLEGVPVRGVDVVEVAAESCFVGDFVGD